MRAKRPTPGDLAEELREITVALRRHARAEFEVPGDTLPYPQLSVLKRLDANGPATTADLARAEGMTAQSMGAIVAALEAGAHVTRRDDESHGRKRIVTITAAGRSTLAANRAVRLRRTASLIAQHFDEDERRVLAAALALLRRAFVPDGRPAVLPSEDHREAAGRRPVVFDRRHDRGTSLVEAAAAGSPRRKT